MKTITKIIPIMGLIAITLVLLIFIDIKDFKKYNEIDGYQKRVFNVDYSEDKSSIIGYISVINKYAKEYNCLLVKNNNGDIYYSVNSIEELIDILSNNLDIDLYDVNYENDSFLATYQTDNDKQIGYIKDFLGDNKITYRLFDNLLLEEGIIHGEYQIFYQNEADYNNFLNAIATDIGSNLNTNIATDTANVENLFIILILVILILISLFFYTFEIYRLYFNAKKIGCMKLLGFNKIKITNYMVKNSFIAYIIAVLVILLLLIIFAKNITFTHLVFILLSYLVVLLFTYYVSFTCVRIILNSYHTSSIIKNQNLASKIAKISTKIKFIVTILLIVLISLLFYASKIVFNTMELYNKSKNTLGYGVMESVSIPVINNLTEKHIKLYQSLYDDDRLEILQVGFGDFFSENEEMQKIINDEIENNVRLYYGDVNKNYLKKENIKVYDVNDNLVNIDDIEDFSFIIAKNKKDTMLELIEKHIQECETMCLDSPHQNSQIYYYDSQKIDTYRLNLDEKYLDGPTLRVVGRNVFGATIDGTMDCGFVSMYGHGIDDTGLKIKIYGSLDETNEILEEYLKEAEIYGIVDKSNFVSYDNYFSTQVGIANLVSSILIASLILIGGTYTLISLQVITLYLKSEKQKVIVKKLLGFDKKDIFEKIIKRNIINNLICFTITFILLIIIGRLDYKVFIISIFIFIIIDIILLLLSIKFSGFSRIFEQLKGGNLWLQLRI